MFWIKNLLRVDNQETLRKFHEIVKLDQKLPG